MRLIKAADDDWASEWDEQHDALKARLGDSYSLRESTSSTVKQRRRLVGFTIFLIVAMPIANWFYPIAWVYVLSAAMAFTIGTNLTIFIISTQIEDKADKMEKKMESLIDELDRAATGLDYFQRELSGINIPAIKEAMDTAREELQPALHRLDGVSWESLSTAVENGFRVWERLDKVKIEKFVRPFLDKGQVMPEFFMTQSSLVVEDVDVDVDVDVDEFMPGLEPVLVSHDELFLPPLDSYD
jgi:hypothetical protein